MRVGAIDCGTNSIRLLIADASTETVNGRTVTRLNDVVRQMRIVRLGQGVDATGWLAQEALDRTFEATREYAKLLRNIRSRSSFRGDECHRYISYRARKLFLPLLL